MLQRSTTSSGTTITVYAFGSEEHVYTASGSKLSDTYYYMLAGRLLGQYNGVTTQFYLTDALGSVVSTFDDTVGSAVILGNQVYGPYGNKIYSAGSILSSIDNRRSDQYDGASPCFIFASMKFLCDLDKALPISLH